MTTTASKPDTKLTLTSSCITKQIIEGGSTTTGAERERAMRARTTLALIRLTNAAAQLPYGSGETKGEASPPLIHTTPVPTSEEYRTRLVGDN